MAERHDASSGKKSPAVLDKTLRGLARRGRRASDWITGAKPVEGFVDRVLASEVLGWAFDPNKPNRRVHIIATLDGKIIAETLADLPRRDLDQHGKGDGRHGFNLRIPAAAKAGGQRVRIEALLGRRRLLLRGGEIVAPEDRAPKPRKPSPLIGAGAGALERIADGVLHGWIPVPRNGGTAIVDIYDDERYLGSVKADKPRPKLQAAAPGARGFQFTLPATLDLSLAKLRARPSGSAADLQGLDGNAAPAVPKTRSGRSLLLGYAEKTVGLLVFDTGDEDAARRTTRSWADQAYKGLDIGRIGAAAEGRQNVFGPGDETGLRQFLNSCQTIAFVRAGETLNPHAARILSTAKPNADILTWDIADDAGGPLMRRRSEAWPLALSLGGSLGGSFAMRSPVVAQFTNQIANSARNLREFELALAAAAHLRWAYLPAPLSAYARDKARPVHLEPESAPSRPQSVTIALWPTWSEEALLTLQSLSAGWGGMQVEVLAPARAVSDEVTLAVEKTFAGSNIRIKPVDIPDGGGVGAVLRALGNAASGEVVLFVRAGLVLEAGEAVDLAAWAITPLAGAVTGRINANGQDVAGVTIQTTPAGWRVISAFDKGKAETSRPVLACPGSLMAVSRARLAAVGGFDSRRFPVGADLDLCFRLRREGWTSLVLGAVRATSPSPAIRRDIDLTLALHDQADLAAASAAFPARDDQGKRFQP
ncbi:MAG: glycosyltransferase [Caulobacteraceae bacterium]